MKSQYYSIEEYHTPHVTFSFRGILAKYTNSIFGFNKDASITHTGTFSIFFKYTDLNVLIISCYIIHNLYYGLFASVSTCHKTLHEVSQLLV